jgi:hypothetical protein
VIWCLSDLVQNTQTQEHKNTKTQKHYSWQLLTAIGAILTVDDRVSVDNYTQEILDLLAH